VSVIPHQHRGAEPRSARSTHADEQIAVLRRDYGRVPTQELTARLGRKKGGVFMKAWTLGLKHGYGRPFSGDEERAIRLAREHGVSLTRYQCRARSRPRRGQQACRPHENPVRHARVPRTVRAALRAPSHHAGDAAGA